MSEPDRLAGDGDVVAIHLDHARVRDQRVEVGRWQKSPAGGIGRRHGTITGRLGDQDRRDGGWVDARGVHIDDRDALRVKIRVNPRGQRVRADRGHQGGRMTEVATGDGRVGGRATSGDGLPVGGQLLVGAWDMWNKLDDVERAQPDEQRGQTKLARNPAQVDDENTSFGPVVFFESRTAATRPA